MIKEREGSGREEGEWKIRKHEPAENVLTFFRTLELTIVGARHTKVRVVVKRAEESFVRNLCGRHPFSERFGLGMV